MNPANKTEQVAKMQEEYPLIDALLGGTRAMRQAGSVFLAKFPGETPDAFDDRLSQAILYPAFSRTIDALAGKPFKKPITLKEDVPDLIAEFTQDINLEGQNITVFSRELMDVALARGITFVYVDYPTTNESQTMADERDLGARPYVCHILPGSVIGMASERIGGREMLTEFRYFEKITIDTGDFKQQTIEQIRVLRPGMWQIWRELEIDRQTQWVMVEEGINSLGKIPVVAVYANRTGFYTGEPSLLELAYMNVDHWNVRSDRQGYIHVLHTPILARFGADVDGEDLQIGRNSIADFDNPDARLEWVEHKGTAAKTGAEWMKELEESMRQAGAEMNIIKPGRYTATQADHDNEQQYSTLQAVAQNLQDALEQILQLMAEYVGLPEGGHVEVFKDFAMPDIPSTLAGLKLAYEANLMTKRQFFAELKKLGVIDSDQDFDETLDQLDNAPPDFGNVLNFRALESVGT